MHEIPINDLRRAYMEQEEELRPAVDRVLASGWYVLGPESSAFEAEFAAFLGGGHCVGVGNGTDALQLALLAVGCLPGDEVVTAANAGAYTSTAALAAGLVPRPADVDPTTLLLTAETAAAQLTERTRAVVVTHLYGLLADVAPLRALCTEAGVALVEDCAQAAGAVGSDGAAGTLADVSTFSFFPTKNLGALGDGGAVVTRRPELAERVGRLRQYGWTSKYVNDVPRGRNSRLDELQAAVLRTRLPRLPEWNARRRSVVARFAAALPEGPRRMVHGEAVESTGYAGHLAVLVTPDREADRAALAAQGIRTDVHYPVPDHRQPVLADAMRDLRLPVCERLAAEVLTVPCFPELTEAEVDRICEGLSGL